MIGLLLLSLLHRRDELALLSGKHHRRGEGQHHVLVHAGVFLREGEGLGHALVDLADQAPEAAGLLGLVLTGLLVET